ncbi:Os08g0198400 [Oryza sativa Japonica Group]|uniref:Os08g0198400 protein n=1 Tax=Oryza sativa subsp. japonica TaxID=39947 RepID=A0A0P0XDB5_ORYSJ|nr:Os08g0198400 [Oryza sativa Japonica Group]
MENQSGQPQYTMADQGFRPFSALMSAPSTAQQHVGSSFSTAVVQVAAAQQSHTDHGNICLADDDGYYWRMTGQSTTQGESSPTILSHYQCAQANCVVQKTVAYTADVETFYRGRHNHLRQSDRLEPMSQVGVLVEASDAAGAAAGPSVPETENGDDQSSGSSDRNEDDAGDVEMDEDAAAGDPNAMQRRKLKSKVWKEFKLVFKDGKLHTAICNHCKLRLVAETRNGTSHLRRHLKICPEKAGTSRVQKKRRSSTSQSQPDLPVSENLENGQENPSQNLENGQENPLEEFMRATVLKLCPFPAMYRASFASFLAGRNPAPNMVPQTTVEDKFISVYEKEKLKLKEKIIATPGGVFLSVNKWYSGSYETGIVCLTVHFIDEEWKINRKTIRCCLSESDGLDLNLFPHWQSEIANYEDDDKMVLKKVVRDWCLEPKLLGVTLEGSVDKKATISLEDDLTTGKNYLVAKCKLLTIPCMVDGLDDLMQYTVGREVRSMWSRYMTNTPERKLKCQEVVSQLQLDRPSFGSKYRYLTFYWCEAALQFIKSFPLSNGSERPSLDDLEATENFCKIARAIYHATKAFYEPYNLTFNSYFHVIWSLRATLQELPRIKNIERVIKVKNMQEKFDNHWKKWYLWLSIAVVLDPRYKLAFIELRFREAFSQDAGTYISEVRAKFYELYIQYSHVNEQSNEILNQGNNGSGTQISAPLHKQRTNYTIAQAALEEFKELFEYLGGGLCPQNDSFDILKWWKDNSAAYPSLAKMARDILAIPGCAVSAESAFNDDSDHRAELFNGKLGPETTEALICAQSWIIKSSDGPFIYWSMMPN